MVTKYSYSFKVLLSNICAKLHYTTKIIRKNKSHHGFLGTHFLSVIMKLFFNINVRLSTVSSTKPVLYSQLNTYSIMKRVNEFPNFW